MAKLNRAGQPAQQSDLINVAQLTAPVRSAQHSLAESGEQAQLS